MAKFLNFLLYFIIFETLLAVFTQFLNIFYFWVILSANLLAVFVLMIASLPRLRNFLRHCRHCERSEAISSCHSRESGNPDCFVALLLAMTKKIDWVFFAVAIISVLTLWQVHYNYTGKFNMVNDALFQYHEAKNMQYAYPYFSDEWYAISFAKESINSHSLPLKNPFTGNFFPNLEMVFHSFIAEIILLFGLNPLTQYTALSVFINTLIILLAYLFLRINNISKNAAAISSLSILYITSASNLPGIWNLLPITMGIVFCLLGFCFLSLHGRSVQCLLAGVFVFLFYPPLIIFYASAVAVYFWSFKKTGAFPLSYAFGFIFSKVFYRALTGDFIPHFNFYNIMSWPIILLAIFGLYFVFRNKKWLFFQLVLGVIFWFFYTFLTFRFVIGFERVVFFTSIIVALIAGFGINEIEKHFKLKYIEIGALILFLVLIPFYTGAENWRSLTMTNPKIGADSIPMAPANNYLTSEDLKIFKNIKQKKFLSTPWKGTVIGIATDNFPFETKGGTVTVNPGAYQQFMKASCVQKAQIAKENNIDYIYSSAFSCSNFKKLNESSEGFILYKYVF